MKTFHTHKNPIGFKVTDNKMVVYEKPGQDDYAKTQDLTFEELMKLKGFEQGVKCIEDYFNVYAYPLLNGEDRDEFFFNQLRNIYNRFFMPVK